MLEHSRMILDRDAPSTANWGTMHVSSFTEKAPDPTLLASFRPEMQPVLPEKSGPATSPSEDSDKVRSMKAFYAEKKKVLGAKKPPLMSTAHCPPLAMQVDPTMTWPRNGSREQLVERPASHVRAQRHGTSKAAAHPPGYMGYIPNPNAGSRACEHGRAPQPRPSQRCKADTLFDSFREKPVGYTGYEPTSVYNRRTWEVPVVTTQGATNATMVGTGYVPRRPEAGGTSALLDDMFAGPLDGRPSDNGVFNSQLYYKLVRPLEGACRSFKPSDTHISGRKFMSPGLTHKNH